MRIIFPTAQTRPFYDRNATYTYLTYSQNGIAPHAFTLRATYTVPANRRALVTSVGLYFRRQTAAAPVGLVSLMAGVDLDISQQFVAMSRSVDNTVNALLDVSYPGQIWLKAGQDFHLATSDAGTGGTCAYTLVAEIIEFDE